ncbi:glycosyltransferase [Roseomonas sp. USHLN139]|uniref:glycosyltransferase n=1 Tax=Roseomonas sp. USHLN139 TaxID=3081298 RepID=UPI003B011766
MTAVPPPRAGGDLSRLRQSIDAARALGDFPTVVEGIEALRQAGLDHGLPPAELARLSHDLAHALYSLRVIPRAWLEAERLRTMPGQDRKQQARSGLLVAQIALLAGHRQQAVAALEPLRARHPRDSAALISLARIAAADAAGAGIDLLRSGLASDGDGRVAAELSEWLGRTGHAAEALAIVEQAGESHGWSPALQGALCNAALRAGDRGRWAAALDALLGDAGLVGAAEEGGSLAGFLNLYAPGHTGAPPPAAGDGTPSPTVAVIMTAYNAEATIGYAIDSVLSQRHGNFTLVVVDDASTDGTAAEIARRAAQDHRIHVIPAAGNRGTFSGKNMALAAVEAEFYTFHDADDWMHPDRLSDHLACMAAHPGCVLSRSKWIRMQGDGILVSAGSRHIRNNPSSFFVRAEVFRRIGGFDPGRWGGDSEFFWRLRRVYGAAATRQIDKVLSIGLSHPASLTTAYLPTDVDGRSDTRWDYNHQWLGWHLSVPAGETLFMSDLPQARPFPLPSALDEAAQGRALVLTTATPDYARTWNFAIEAQRRYAERYGHAHRLFSTPAPGMNAKWSKLDYALKALRQGSHVLLLDADAAPTPFAPDFLPLLEAHPGKDIFYVEGNSGRANSGVLLLRGGPEGRAAAFLEACLQHRHQPVDAAHFVTAEGENGHVIQFLSRPPFADAAQRLPRLWNCSHPEGQAQAYIRHYTNQLSLSLVGPGQAWPEHPPVFLLPAKSDSLYLQLLTGPLAGRYHRFFRDTSSLPQAVAWAAAGVPTLLHLHWEEFFLRDLATAAAAAERAASVGALLLAYHRAGGRMLWTVHNEWPHRVPHTEAFLALRRQIARLADVVLVHHRDAVDVLQSQGCAPRGVVEVLPHPSYSGLYEPEEDTVAALEAGPAEEPTILCFGRLEARKGFEPALATLDTAFLTAAGARLRIAGEGAYGAELFAAHGHRTEIDWDLRFIPQAEVGGLFRRAACLVLPYEQFLTSGIALLALTLGAVLVAPEAPPFTELVPAEARRFLYRPGDAGDLRRAVSEVLGLTPAERLALRRAGLQAVQGLHPQDISRRLGEIYDREIRLAAQGDPEHAAAMAAMELVRPLPAPAGPLLAVWPDKALVAENWGDKLNPVLIELVSGRPVLSLTLADPQESAMPVQRVIGSGLNNADERQVVWGSGFIRSDPRLPLSRAIHAVRGPWTRDHLLEHGIDCPPVYGDAALLLPLFYRPKVEARYELGIIQHFRDAESEPLPPVPPGMTVKVIDILGSITGVIDDVLSCRQIVSSSLHGLIIAHAYGIPASWIKFGDRPLGDDFKFRDYWASVGWRHAAPILCSPDGSAADLVGELTTTQPLLCPQELIRACPFIDRQRREALLERCRAVMPQMPPVRFLARARDPVEAPLPVASGDFDDRLPWLSFIMPVAAGAVAAAAVLRDLAGMPAAEGVEILVADARQEADEDLRGLAQSLGASYLHLPEAAGDACAAAEAAAGRSIAPRIAISAPGTAYPPGLLAQIRGWTGALPDAVLALPTARLLGDVPAGAAAAASCWDLISALDARPLWEPGCLVLRRDAFARAYGLAPRSASGSAFFWLMLRCRQDGQPVVWQDERLLELRQLVAQPETAAAPPAPAVLYGPHPLRGIATPVSVVIATRNRQALLRQALRSVQEQSFSDIEIVVIDDGSTDGTAEVLAAVDDPRLRAVSLAAHGGIAEARNLGNRLARGRYIAVHDDDDLMLPRRLEWQLAALQPGDAGSYGGWINVMPREDGGDLDYRPGLAPFGLGELLLSSSLQNHPTLLLSREVALRVPYDRRLVAGSDFQLVSRLALAGYPLRHCGKYVTLRRFHADNLTRHKSHLQSAGSRLIRSAILGACPAAHEQALKKAAAAARAPSIQQDDLPAEIGRMLGQDYALAARSWPCQEPAVIDRLRQQGPPCAVRLRRQGMTMHPELVVVLDQALPQPGDAGAALSACGLPGPGEIQPLRLRRRFDVTAPARAAALHLLAPERLAARAPASFLDSWILDDQPDRYLGAWMGGSDWPSGAAPFLPVDEQEHGWLILDGDGREGGWRLLFARDGEQRDAIRLALLAGRYPSARLGTFTQEQRS